MSGRLTTQPSGIRRRPSGSPERHAGGTKLPHGAGTELRASQPELDEIYNVQARLSARPRIAASRSSELLGESACGCAALCGYAVTWFATSNVVSVGGALKPPSMPAVMRGMRVSLRKRSQSSREV